MKYLNEILIEWNDSDIEDNGIVKSSDVRKKISNKKLFIVNDIKFNMIRIPDTDWMIGETPVTMGLWEKVVSTDAERHTTYSNPWGIYRKYDPLYPVCNVSYNDCVYFINELNSIFETSNFDIMPGWLWAKAFKEGGIKLPGEESVDIADDQDEDYTGMLEKYGWFGGDGIGIKEVATKSPDNLGIYDMIGNVWEICSSDDFSPLFFGGSCETDFSMFMSPGSYPFVGFKAQSKYTREDDTGFRLAYKIE